MPHRWNRLRSLASGIRFGARKTPRRCPEFIFFREDRCLALGRGHVGTRHAFRFPDFPAETIASRAAQTCVTELRGLISAR